MHPISNMKAPGHTLGARARIGVAVADSGPRTPLSQYGPVLAGGVQGPESPTATPILAQGGFLRPKKLHLQAGAWAGRQK